MLLIKRIKIKNFRSIVSLGRGIELNHLNVLVGNNDAGKSNILKALNLFFNGETDVGKQFRFEEEFSYFANITRGKAKEIRIELIFAVPLDRFANSKDVSWVKRWRTDTTYEEMTYIDKSDINPRSKVRQWLNKINYRYIPATKGVSYFEQLMGDLHDVLDAVHNERFRMQGGNFVQSIQDITEDITRELEQKIGLKNTLQVPSDFKLLFSNLDFGYEDKKNTYLLKSRGDGIKARHIPIILKYMAKQERAISKQGFVNPDTIWGFEEPENNLEMKFAFDSALTFLQYAKDIQIFLTTHSPAFYSLCKTENNTVSRFFIESPLHGESKVKLANKIDDHIFHEKMGILPLITPYIEEINKQQEKQELLTKRLEQLEDTCKCVVLTEDGNTDYIKAILNYSKFKINEVEVESYRGSDNINQALAIGKYIQEKRPHLQIIVHRDRDYLTSEEIDTFKKQVISKGFKPIVTQGTDIESYFINAEHINYLYPKIALERCREYIDEATSLAEKASLEKLVNHYLRVTKYTPNGQSYSKIENWKQKYFHDKCRYRYGKKVLGHLKSLIQKELKTNADLISQSPFVEHPELVVIAEKIWG